MPTKPRRTAKSVILCLGVAPLLVMWMFLASYASAQAAIGVQPVGRPLPSQGQLPFVDISGVVGGDLQRGMVERELGTPREGAGGALLHYPERGLTFGLASGSTGPSAPVHWMQVDAPANAETFGGLRVGLPQAAAIRAIQQDYYVVARLLNPGTAAQSPDELMRTMRLTDRERRTKREVEVTFSAGKVDRLRFVTHSSDAGSASRMRGELSTQQRLVVAVATVLALVSIFSGRSVTSSLSFFSPKHRSGPWGAAFVLLGMAIAWQSWIWVRGADGWGAMLGVAGFGFALFSAFLGLVFMARSESRLWAWPAKGLLVLLVIAQVWQQFGR